MHQPKHSTIRLFSFQMVKVRLPHSQFYTWKLIKILNSLFNKNWRNYSPNMVWWTFDGQGGERDKEILSQKISHGRRVGCNFFIWPTESTILVISQAMQTSTSITTPKHYLRSLTIYLNTYMLHSCTSRTSSLHKLLAEYSSWSWSAKARSFNIIFLH